MTMERRKQAEIRLTQLSAQVRAWRQARRRHARMPGEFWEEAVALAAELGFAAVRRELMLNQDSLLRRLADRYEEASERPEETSTFVELIPEHRLPSTGLVLELEDKVGVRLTLRLPSAPPQALSQVISAFRGMR